MSKASVKVGRLSLTSIFNSNIHGGWKLRLEAEKRVFEI